jgi:hypothetical protein
MSAIVVHVNGAPRGCIAVCVLGEVGPPGHLRENKAIRTELGICMDGEEQLGVDLSEATRNRETGSDLFSLFSRPRSQCETGLRAA